MSQGVDIRENSTIEIDELLTDSAGAIITTGTATLKLYERNGTDLRSFDFADNTFKTTALTSETANLTHQTGNNGATNTGHWLYDQTNVGGFTPGNRYFAYIEHASLVQPIVRKFQWGIASGSLDLFSDQVDLVNAPNGTAVTAIQNGLATTANQTTILNTLGAWTGTGINNLLGAFRALFRSDTDVSVPSDINANLGSGVGTADSNDDSLQGISEGGASGLTQQQVRDSMKLAPTAGAPSGGSVDAELDSIVSTIGAGAVGAFEITFTVDIGGVLLPEADVVVTQVDSAIDENVVDARRSNANASVTFPGLDAGTYWIHVQKVGVQSPLAPLKLTVVDGDTFSFAST